MALDGKTVLITGGAKRIGKHLAFTLAKAGADIIIQYSQSRNEAEETASEIFKLGVNVYLYPANFNDESNIVKFIEHVLQSHKVFGLINNASIFEPYDFKETTIKTWADHLNINLTAPFILSQYFGKSKINGDKGRIINILDWRAMRPGKDHFAYTISKSALLALTQSTAQALAPNITVNGLALGAILPPSDGGQTNQIIQNVPAQRWGSLDEVGEALLFLIDGPEFITGEIIHVDGGRHLT
jgi:NAD(P)-dependent dehydrogenase (short-subunit alcohol dehydrogenase family)